MRLARPIATASCGVVLVIAAAAIASAPKDAVVVLASLAVAAAAYGVAVFLIGAEERARRIGRRELLALAAVGLLARLALLFSAPVLEDDVHRYLWDGAVLADGHSPYAFSPQQIYDARLERPETPTTPTATSSLDALVRLSAHPALEPHFLAINYPSVPTIYPPLAELSFAALAIASPGDLVAMKLALLALDIACALALLAILASTGAPRAFALLYWWNPLIVLVFAGSAHMDVLPMALLLIAVALALRKRAVASGVLLGLAAAAKLFPIVCWPALRRQLGLAGTAAAALTTALLYVALWHPRMFEGLATFASVWQINGAIHAALAALVGADPARVIAGLFVAGVALWFSRRRPLEALSFALAALILASPAVNPWYVAWVVPFAAALRSLPLLVLSLTVLASYVRFLSGDLPPWLPWLEFGIPLLTAIALHFGRSRDRQRPET